MKGFIGVSGICFFCWMASRAGSVWHFGLGYEFMISSLLDLLDTLSSNDPYPYTLFMLR
jgi:hypothetical protein